MLLELSPVRKKNASLVPDGKHKYVMSKSKHPFVLNIYEEMKAVPEEYCRRQKYWHVLENIVHICFYVLCMQMHMYIINVFYTLCILIDYVLF